MQFCIILCSNVFSSGFLSLGYSTPFLSLGASYMYSSLAMAKAAVISVGEEIATMGLPSGICPLVFVFTGAGNGMACHCIIFRDGARRVNLGGQKIY